MQKLIIREQAEDLNEPILIDRDRMVEVKEVVGRFQADGMDLCDLRATYEFANKAIYLTNQFDWVFGTDSNGMSCAVPLKK